jgi:uncharacterized membrane protein
MAQIEVSIFIKKSIKVVYQAFIDPENMLHWMSYLEKVETINGKFGEAGATARLYYNQKGRKSILEDKLEYLEPGKKIISSVKGKGISVRVENEFKHKENATELAMNWYGKGNNIFISLMLRLLKGKIKKQMQAELNAFKELVEKYGIKFYSIPNE